MTGAHARPAKSQSEPTAPPPGLAARRIAADIVDGVLRQKRALDEQLEPAATSARCPNATARWCGSSSPPCCAGSAPCGICSASMLERGLPASAPRVEAVAADRRRANPVSRRARSRRGRSVGAAGAGRPPRLALCRPGQRACCASSRATARPSSPRSTPRCSTRPDWLMRRWIAHYGDATARAIAAAHTPRAGARSHRQERSGSAGPTRSAAACLPTGTVRAGRIRPDPAAARLRRGRVVGAGRRRGAAGAAARRRAPARRSPISAPRPAARPRSSRWPARRSPRSTARSRASRGFGRIWRGCSSTPRSSRPTPRHWQGGPFDAVLLDAPCSSTGTIRRHPDIPGCKSEADLAKLAALQTPAARPRGRRCSSRAARWSIAPVRSNPRRARTQIAALLGRTSGLRRGPIRGRRDRAATPSF